MLVRVACRWVLRRKTLAAADEKSHISNMVLVKMIKDRSWKSLFSRYSEQLLQKVGNLVGNRMKDSSKSSTKVR